MQRKRIGLVFILIGVFTIGFVRYARAQSDPASVLHNAWASTERAGQYGFESRLTQTTIPANRMSAAGRTASTETLFIEGISDRRDRSLHLTLWDDPTTVHETRQAMEIKIEGTEAMGRMSTAEDFQPIDNLSDAFAPSGDAAAFLAAAENVLPLGSETRSVPTRSGEMIDISFDRYRFTVNGDQYAVMMRQQLQDELLRTGALPRGLTLGASDTYRNMVAEGEAWITPDGLPLRFSLAIEYPVQANGERVLVDMTTTFVEFERVPVGMGVRSTVANAIEGLTQTLFTTQAAMNLSVVTVALFMTVGLLVLRPEKTQKPFALLLSAQMAFAPLTAVMDGQTLRELTEQFPHMKVAVADSAEIAQQAINDLLNTRAPFDTTQPPLVVGQQQAEVADLIKPDTVRSVAAGDDVDKDGLDATLESAFFTSPNNADHDGDGLSDGTEVALCPDKTGWPGGSPNEGIVTCPDPYYADTDLDGLLDGEEVDYLGTHPQQKDSDEDGITDGAEVQGFLMPDGTTRRYSDPLNPDHDGDGQIDGLECPQLQRPAITDDYRGDTSGNSPWSASIQCQDSDGDGQPDIFDFDDDGDGVPSNIDLTPVGSVSQPFNRTTPMKLELQNLTDNKPVLVELQIRPIIPEHLSYALNVLDWPSGDGAGQIQRWNNSTFGSVAADTSLLRSNDAAFQGDMRLSPMLEVIMPGNTTDLPRTNANHEISLNTSGNLLSTLDFTIRASGGMTITVRDAGDERPATARVYKSSCENVGSSPVVSVGTYSSSGFKTTTPINLATIADGSHVIQLTRDAKVYCQSIPTLVDGTTTLPIYMQDPGESLGTLYMEQSGTNVVFNPTYTDTNASYDLSVKAGTCRDRGAFKGGIDNLGHFGYENISNVSQLVDIVDGSHVLIMEIGSREVACLPLGNIVNGDLNTMIDSDAMADYQITVSENQDGTLSALVPLLLATDQATGRNEAFNAQMFYTHSSGTLNHTVNLVWLVSALTDYCPDGDCNHPAAVENQLRIVHRYRDEQWILAGLDVTEQHGIQTALVYEDPSAETDTLAEREENLIEWDDNLWHLANGLQRVFLEGRDCDAGDGETCAGSTDGQRDLKVTDIKTRWDSGNPPSDVQRWGIDSDALNVEELTLAHPGQLGQVTSVIDDILANQFQPTYNFTSTTGTPTTVVYPTVLIASEHKARTIGIGSDDHFNFANNTVTVDFEPSAAQRIDLITQATLTWKPFRHTGGEWKAMPITEYWDRLERHLPNAGAYTAGEDEVSEYETAADIRLTQVAYLTLYNGMANPVEVGEAGTAQLLYNLESVDAVTDNSLADTSNSIKASGKTVGGLTLSFLKPVIAELDQDYSIYQATKKLFGDDIGVYNKFSARESIGRALKSAAPDVVGWTRFRDTSKNVTLSGRARGVGSLFNSAAANIAVGTAKSIASIGHDKSSTTQTVVINTLQGIGTAQAIGSSAALYRKVQKLRALPANAGKGIKTWSQGLKPNKAGRYAGTIGLVLEAGFSIAVFAFQMASAGVVAFSLAFNSAASDVIASLVVSAALLVLASTGIGAIIVAIIGLIDALIALFCGLFPPNDENPTLGDKVAAWTCKGITGILAAGVAYFIYDDNDIIDIDNPYRLSILQMNPLLANPAAGFAQGAAIDMEMTVQNVVQTQGPDSLLSALYAWQYNESNTRSTSFAYAVTAEEERDTTKQIHNEVELDTHPTQWNYDLQTDKYLLTVDIDETEGVALDDSGINVPVSAYLAEGYASPTQECFLIPPVPPVNPVPIPVCHVRSRNESNYQPLNLQFDVFPATLSGFYQLAPKDGGQSFAWGRGGNLSLQFPRMADADGDGLHYTIDPDDSNFDTDGDGLTDFREKEIGSNPLLGNSDGDALSDLEEVRFGTDPTLSDTDGDGLDDAAEKAGWDIAYNYVDNVAKLSWAYPNPKMSDGDGDTIFDRREKALGFSPHVVNDPQVLDPKVVLAETDAVKLIVGLDEGANKAIFADTSKPNSNIKGTCADDACPTSGVRGFVRNSAYFDGDDFISLGYVPLVNQQTNNFSVAAWVRPDNLSGNRRIISVARTNGNDSFGFGTVGNQLKFTMWGVADFVSSASSELVVGEWAHVAMTTSASGGQTTVNFYVNGELHDSVTQSVSGATPSPNDDVLIGAATETSSIELIEPWIGRLDEVVMHGFVLSETEVFETLFTIYNLNDNILTGDAPFTLESSLENKLLNRNLEGVQQTTYSPELTSDIEPRNFVLPPKSELPPQLSFFGFANANTASGKYAIEQTTAAIVDVPPVSAPSTDANLVYRRASVGNFNGTSDRVSVSADSDLHLNTTDFTLSVWLKPSSSSVRRGVLGYGSGDGYAYPSIQLQGSQLYFGYGTGDAINPTYIERSLSNAVPQDGEWHHVLISYDRNNGAGNAVASVYVDSSFKGDLNFGSQRPFSAFNQFDIGRSSQKGKFKFTTFNLTCEADGAGDGEYNINYYDGGARTNNLYWSGSGTDGQNLSIHGNWHTFTNKTTIAICENDADGSDRTTCDDNDELMQRLSLLPLVFDTATSLGDSGSAEFSTTPNDPNCGFWTGYDDTATVAWEYQNNSLPYKGAMKDVRLYNRTFTTTDVNNLFQSDTIIAYYKMDDRPGATIFADELASSSATCGNDCPLTGVVGRENVAVQLDGVNDFVVADKVSTLAASAANSGNKGLSFGGWVKPDVNLIDNEPYIMSFHTSAYGNRLLLGLKDFSPNVSARIFTDNGSGTTEDVSSAALYPAGDWLHVFVTIDYNNTVNNGKLFVNGDRVAYFSTNAKPTSTGRFSIGQEWDGSTPSDLFNGAIDEVIVLKKALTEAEVEAEYNRVPRLLLAQEDTDGFLKINTLGQINGSARRSVFMTHNGVQVFDFEFNSFEGTTQLVPDSVIPIPAGEQRFKLYAINSSGTIIALGTITVPANRNYGSFFTNYNGTETSYTIFESDANTPVGAEGQIGDGASFEPDQYLTIGGDNEVEDSYTVMTWVYPRTVVGSGTVYRPIVAAEAGTYDSLDNRYETRLNASLWLGLIDGKPAMQSSTFFSPTPPPLMADLAIPTEQWSHLTFRSTVSGGVNNYQIYVNGTPVKSGTTSHNNSATNHDRTRVFLGRGHDPATETQSFFDGIIDETAIYKRALTDEEIVNAYNFQVAWLDEERSFSVTVDRDEPTVSLAEEGEILPQETQTLVLDVFDEHSYVNSAAVLYGDDNGDDGGAVFAAPCEDAEADGRTFCFSFTPTAEGRYGYEFTAIDAAGNFPDDGSNHYIYFDGTGPTLTQTPLPSTPFASTIVNNKPGFRSIELSGTVVDPNLPGGYAPAGVTTVAVTLFAENGEPVGAPIEQQAFIDGTSWLRSYQINKKDATGIYTGVIVATDAVGNETQLPIGSFTIDDTAAGVTYGNGGGRLSADNALNLNTPIIGSVSDDEKLPTLPSAGVSGVQFSLEAQLPHGSQQNEVRLSNQTELFFPFDRSQSIDGQTDNSFENLAGFRTATCSDTGCPTSGISSPNGQGLQFDGVDDALTLSNDDDVNQLTNDFTVAAWINPHALSGIGRIISTARTLSKDNGYGLGHFNDRLILTTFGVKDYITAGSYLQPNLWQHVAVHLNSSNDAEFYVNGVLVETVSHSSPAIPDTDDLFMIGAMTTQGDPTPIQLFNGIIDTPAVVHGKPVHADWDALFGMQPTLIVPFDERGVDFLTIFDVEGEMGAFNSFFGIQGGGGYGEPNHDVPGAVGARALRLGIMGSEVSVSAPDGVLPHGDDSYTISLWVEDMGYGGILFGDNVLYFDINGLEHSFNNSTFTTGYPRPGSTTGWHLLAFTYDAETHTQAIYHNGELLRSDVVPSADRPNGTPNELRLIFTSDHQGNIRSYSVDDLRVYQRPLSAEELTAMSKTRWQDAALNSRSSQFNASLPADVEGFYDLLLRGSDAAGNVDEEVEPVFSGIVDTKRPMMTITEAPISGGFRYTLVAHDFALNIESVSWPSACDGNSALVDGAYNESPWVLALEEQAGSAVELLTMLEATCEVSSPLSPSAPVTICDIAGNCLTVTVDGTVVPTAVQLSNMSHATSSAAVIVLATLLLLGLSLVVRRKRRY